MPKLRKITPPPDDKPERDTNKRDTSKRNDYGYDNWDGYYPPSQPIATDKGIKARNQRGAFGESWWAKRWIAALDTFGWGNRLQRGRTYARKGQVLSIAFAGPQIKAKVQGSSPRPYSVTIDITSLSDAQWEKAIDALSEQAIFAAKLLAGEMPQDIETAFAAARVPLFPTGPRDIDADCSCPDYANPCKHIAAVYYLLGERFDEDPFLIFQVRGRTRDQIVGALRARRVTESSASEVVMAAPVETAPPLEALLAQFYEAGPELEQIAPRIAAPAIEAALLRRFGPAPADADADLRRVYSAITAATLERVLGEEGER